MEKEIFIKYLHGAVQLHASDIHFKVGSPTCYRLQKVLRPVKGEPLTSADTLSICQHIVVDEEILKKLDRVQDYDTSYSLPGVCRFRVNIFRQRGALSLVLRTIPQNIPSFEDLLLPPQVKDLAEYTRGLVLITGSAGTGKSSTLAAIINHINETRQAHVVTIEDPIEFLHKDNHCVISQREVGVDTVDFNKALRAALRQDPDVILVGEMRDLETIDIALKASETGHMVYSTVHTPDAAKTIGRLIAVFPPNEQEMVRIRLAENLKATLSQRLLPRADGKGMVVALELMKVTGTMEDYIKDAERSGALKDIIEKGRQQYGMISFDQCLTDLYKGELITLDTAKRFATSPGDFERALHFD
ncbi:MAG: PilT/PilU family type 4a pilus ATPase [Deltaproteobacteria bacterium]|nr:PilT/PilU family type 4a pilus ATPase [Deltaproteobacteria bacterium]